MPQTDVLQLGNKQLQLLSLLDFYGKEIDFLKNLLQEVVEKNTGKASRTEAEHFQNQFMLQQKNIDELKIKINQNKHLAYIDLKEHEGLVDDKIIKESKSIENEVLSFEKIILELRQAYKKYLAKWM